MVRKPHVNLIIAVVILLFARNPALAQNGLGDPLISTTFGAGATAHGEEQPGLNNYTFTNADVPPIGSYTVLNNTNVAPAIWWPTTDHTPNDGNNGYMMIVKTRTNEFEVLYEHWAAGLCPGTTYEFGAYLMNLTRIPGGTQPTILLRVLEAPTSTTKGAQINEISYGPVAQLTANPSAADWNLNNPVMPFVAPPGVNAVWVQIISRYAGGAGVNDLAIDDVTLNAKGQGIEANFVGSFNPSPCANSPEPYSVTVTAPDPGNVIKWQRKINNGSWQDVTSPGTSVDYSFQSETTAGTYYYRAASAPPGKIDFFSCSVVSNELVIVVKPVVTANAGPQKFYLRDRPPVMLEGNSNSSNVTWEVVSGDDITSLTSATITTPMARPNQTTVYQLTARADANTCGPDTPPSMVTVLVADDVDPANTFTPNGDGINDRWVVDGLASYPNAITQIYNRNGQLVFRAVGGGAPPWDGTYNGKNVPAGSYYYILELGIYGLKRSGSVTVLR